MALWHARQDLRPKTTVSDRRSSIPPRAREYADGILAWEPWAAAGDYADADRLSKPLLHLRERLLAGGPGGPDALAALLNDWDPWLRLCAACDLLPYDRRRGLSALEELSKNPWELGLRARAILTALERRHWPAGAPAYVPIEQLLAEYPTSTLRLALDFAPAEIDSRRKVAKSPRDGATWEAIAALGCEVEISVDGRNALAAIGEMEGAHPFVGGRIRHVGWPGSIQKILDGLQELIRDAEDPRLWFEAQLLRLCFAPQGERLAVFIESEDDRRFLAMCDRAAFIGEILRACEDSWRKVGVLLPEASGAENFRKLRTSLDETAELFSRWRNSSK